MVSLDYFINLIRAERKKTIRMLKKKQHPNYFILKEIVYINYLAVINHLKNNIYNAGFSLEENLTPSKEILEEDPNYEYVCNRINHHRKTMKLSNPQS